MAAAAVLLAILAGAAAAMCLLPMTAGDLGALVGLLAVTAGGSVAGGLALLRWLDRRAARLVTRAFVAGAMGAVSAMVSIVAVALFMFANTAHDLRLLLAVSVTSGGVAALVAAAGARAQTRRVLRLLAEVEALSHERASRPAVGAGSVAGAERSGGDELRALDAAVRRLRERLDHAEAGRRAAEQERHELSSAISHDLRTPLAALRATIDALTEGVVTEPADVDAYHRRMRREVDRLSRLVDDLLELARLEADRIAAGALAAARAEWRPLSLREIAQEVVDSMEPLAARDRIRLDLPPTPALPPVTVDGARIERAVSNLLRNAIQHAAPGSVIRVTVEAAPGGGQRLVVHNAGEPIPAAALPRIWERFYRVEPSRARPGQADGDGAGLGLAIVRAIVEWHGGDVEARSDPASGTALGFRLPAA